MNSCLKCAHWTPSGATFPSQQKGVCRRYPPGLCISGAYELCKDVPQSMRRHRFPETLHNEVCGEFRGKP
jgi:hypothetical protein